MLTEKLCLFENKNSNFVTQIFEMSKKKRILESNNNIDKEDSITSKNDKIKLSNYEAELEDKLKISDLS